MRFRIVLTALLIVNLLATVLAPVSRAQDGTQPTQAVAETQSPEQPAQQPAVQDPPKDQPAVAQQEPPKEQPVQPEVKPESSQQPAKETQVQQQISTQQAPQPEATQEVNSAPTVAEQQPEKPADTTKKLHKDKADKSADSGKPVNDGKKEKPKGKEKNPDTKEIPVQTMSAPATKVAESQVQVATQAAVATQIDTIQVVPTLVQPKNNKEKPTKVSTQPAQATSVPPVVEIAATNVVTEAATQQVTKSAADEANRAVTSAATEEVTPTVLPTTQLATALATSESTLNPTPTLIASPTKTSGSTCSLNISKAGDAPHMFNFNVTWSGGQVTVNDGNGGGYPLEGESGSHSNPVNYPWKPSGTADYSVTVTGSDGKVCASGSVHIDFGPVTPDAIQSETPTPTVTVTKVVIVTKEATSTNTPTNTPIAVSPTVTLTPTPTRTSTSKGQCGIHLTHDASMEPHAGWSAAFVWSGWPDGSVVTVDWLDGSAPYQAVGSAGDGNKPHDFAWNAEVASVTMSIGGQGCVSDSQQIVRNNGTPTAIVTPVLPPTVAPANTVPIQNNAAASQPQQGQQPSSGVQIVTNYHPNLPDVKISADHPVLTFPDDPHRGPMLLTWGENPGEINGGYDINLNKPGYWLFAGGSVALSGITECKNAANKGCILMVFAPKGKNKLNGAAYGFNVTGGFQPKFSQVDISKAAQIVSQIYTDELHRSGCVGGCQVVEIQVVVLNDKGQKVAHWVIISTRSAK